VGEKVEIANVTGKVEGLVEGMNLQTTFGQAAELRPHLLALVQERLTEAGITLAD
jgi:hypothetical protein